MEMATPMVRCTPTVTVRSCPNLRSRTPIRRSHPRRQEADPVVDPGQGAGSDLARLGRTGGQDVVQGVRVVQVGQRPVTERAQLGGDEVGQIALEIAVTLAGVVLL